MEVQWTLHTEILIASWGDGATMKAHWILTSELGIVERTETQRNATRQPGWHSLDDELDILRCYCITFYWVYVRLHLLWTQELLSQRDTVGVSSFT